MDLYCSYEKKCFPYTTCEEDGTCFGHIKTTGPNGWSHNINTKYSVFFNGLDIPIVQTKRDFSVVYSTDHELYDQSLLKAYRYGGVTYWPYCSEDIPKKLYQASVSEDCEITKTTLYFLDHRHGVLLYRKKKEWIKFNLSSTENTKFKETWGTGDYHKLKIKRGDELNYDAGGIEEWHLVTTDGDQIISTLPYGKACFGDAVILEGGICTPEYAQKTRELEKNTELILVVPQPPSKAIPWDYDTRCLGFYDYGHGEGEESILNIEDGGGKDMFYPSWCRSLHVDPFWREAADRRYNVTWWRDAVQETSSYIPPPITVDPLPNGSFVNHPSLGNVYQWLLSTVDGKYKIDTSPDVNNLIDEALPVEIKTHDTTLYYPIGVI